MLKQVDPQIPRCLYSNRGIRLDTIRPAGKHLRLEPATVERVQQDDPGDIYYTIKMLTSGIERETSAKYLAPIVSSPSLNQSTTQCYTLKDINHQIDIIKCFQSDNERINAELIEQWDDELKDAHSAIIALAKTVGIGKKRTWPRGKVSARKAAEKSNDPKPY